LKGDERRLRASFTLPPNQLDWLKKEAVRYGISRSDLLSQLIFEMQYSKTEKRVVAKARFHISKEALAHFCKKYGVKKISLFGSVLTDRFGEKSDVDILVKFEEGYQATLFTISEMEEELSKLFGGRKVDVRTSQDLSRYFRSEVEKEAEELYAA